MIPGDRLERCAYRVLNADTFELIVAPAIADLQFEASERARPPLTGYVGVWKAIALGLLLDVIRAWQANMDTIVPLLLIQSAYYACLFGIAGGLGRTKGPQAIEMLMSPGSVEVVVILSITVLLPAVTVAGCFMARARRA